MKQHIKQILEHDQVIQNLNSLLNYDDRNEAFNEEKLKRFLELSKKAFADNLKVALERSVDKGGINPKHAQVEIAFLKSHLGVVKDGAKGVKKIKKRFGLKTIDNAAIEQIFFELYGQGDRANVLNKIKLIAEHIIEVSNKEIGIVKHMRKVEDHILNDLEKIEVTVLGKGAKSAVNSESKKQEAAEVALEKDNLTKLSEEVAKLIIDKRLKLNSKGELIYERPKNLEEEEILILKFLAITLHMLHLKSNKFFSVLEHQEAELNREIKTINEAINKESDVVPLGIYFEKILQHAEKLHSDTSSDPNNRIDIYHEKYLIDQMWGYTKKLKLKLAELKRIRDARKKGRFLLAFKDVKAKRISIVDGDSEYIESEEFRLDDFSYDEISIGRTHGNAILIENEKVVPFVIDKSLGAVMSLSKNIPRQYNAIPKLPKTGDKSPIDVVSKFPILIKRENDWFYLSLETLPLLKNARREELKKALKLKDNVSLTALSPDAGFILISGDIIYSKDKALFKFENRDDKGDEVKDDPEKIESVKVKSAKKEQDFADHLLDSIIEWDEMVQKSKTPLQMCGYNNLVSFLVGKGLGTTENEICKNAGIDAKTLYEFWLGTNSAQFELVALSKSKGEKEGKEAEKKATEIKKDKRSVAEKAADSVENSEDKPKKTEVEQREKRLEELKALLEAYKKEQDDKFKNPTRGNLLKLIIHLCQKKNLKNSVELYKYYGIDSVYLWNLWSELLAGKHKKAEEKDLNKLAELTNLISEWDSKAIVSGPILETGSALNMVDFLKEKTKKKDAQAVAEYFGIGKDALFKLHRDTQAGMAYRDKAS